MSKHGVVTVKGELWVGDRAQKNRTLKCVYGITLDEYEDMLRAQHGMCAMCGHADPKRSLCVDHNHGTGNVRALLCHDCNKALGFYEKRAEQIAAYLEAYDV